MFSALVFSLFATTSVSAQNVYLRPYGTAATVDFCLWETDATDLKTDAVIVAGDVKLSKDEGAEANCSTGAGACVTDEGQCYSVALTATELQAQRVYVAIVDSAVKTWLDKTLVIETYGYDGNAQAGTTTTITLAAAASSSDNYYSKKTRVDITAGTGAGQSACIDTYTGSTRVAYVVPPFVTAPTTASVYELVGDAGCNDASYAASLNANAQIVVLDAVAMSGTGSTNHSQVMLLDGFEPAIAWGYGDYVSGAGATLDMKIQHSADGTNWVDLGVQFDQVGTTDAGSYKKIDGATMRYVRAVSTRAGTTPVYNGTVHVWGRFKN